MFGFFVAVLSLTAVIIVTEAFLDENPAHRPGYIAFSLTWLFTACSPLIFGNVVFVCLTTILFAVVAEDCYWRRQ